MAAQCRLAATRRTLHGELSAQRLVVDGHPPDLVGLGVPFDELARNSTMLRVIVRGLLKVDVLPPDARSSPRGAPAPLPTTGSTSEASGSLFTAASMSRSGHMCRGSRDETGREQEPERSLAGVQRYESVSGCRSGARQLPGASNDMLAASESERIEIEHAPRPVIVLDVRR